MRKRSCFCLICVKEMMVETLTWGESHCISKREATANNIEIDPYLNMYCFNKSECVSSLGPGLQKQIQVKQIINMKLRLHCQLDWVICNGYKDEVEPIWIGRVVSTSA